MSEPESLQLEDTVERAEVEVIRRKETCVASNGSVTDNTYFGSIRNVSRSLEHSDGQAGSPAAVKRHR